MNAEALYELLGDLDEQMVHAAERRIPMKRKNRMIAALSAAAACTALICGIGLWHHNAKPPLPESSASSETASDAEYADVQIFYVEQGEIRSMTEYLPCIPKDIFARWKAYNSIGDEVELLRVKIDSNGTEHSDSSVAGYTVGDRFTLNVTVTANLRDYCGGGEPDPLLESLRQTMTSYSHVTFDDYNLILE